MAQVKNLLSHVNKLRSHRIIQQPPKWYQPMAIVPPPLPPPHCVYDYNLEGSQNFEKELTNEQESHYRTQIQARCSTKKIL
ncbi:hypothetical protein HMI55_002144 [Coelomomyces lativittatus]|nr:hypothetical protein HMI55_002144 [Coelomomyces lativittatus]